MKKFFLAMMFVVLSQGAMAQEVQKAMPKFATFSYAKVLEAMPEYATVKNDLAALRKKFDDEAKRSEDDFNQKYELFLEGQRDFAPSIMKKRRSELEEMLLMGMGGMGGLGLGMNPQTSQQSGETKLDA